MKLILDLTKGQIQHVKDMLYNDTQIDEFSGAMSRAVYEKIERAASLSGIKERVDKPRGHRWCGEPVQTTTKAVRVRYYSHDLWLPKSQVVLVDGQITAPAHAIDNAKHWNEVNT